MGDWTYKPTDDCSLDSSGVNTLCVSCLLQWILRGNVWQRCPAKGKLPQKAKDGSGWKVSDHLCLRQETHEEDGCGRGRVAPAAATVAAHQDRRCNSQPGLFHRHDRWVGRRRGVRFRYFRLNTEKRMKFGINCWLHVQETRVVKFFPLCNVKITQYNHRTMTVQRVGERDSPYLTVSLIA